MKTVRGKIYTWESNNIPVYLLAKGMSIGFVHVLTWDSEIHYIPSEYLIKLTSAHKNLDWCKKLSNNKEY
tara:strand:+ start:318 stop:527 length:210 start_codon:yes stop_codon:yes gene_type:complete